MTIVHISMSPLRHASRILKECRSTRQAGVSDPIIVIGIGEAGLAPREEMGDRVCIRRLRLRSRSWSKTFPVQLVKYLEWSVRVLRDVRPVDLKLVHAHSLPALPVCVMLKIINGKPLVYDAHELESQKERRNQAVTWLTGAAERFLLRFVDDAIVVSNKIADWYELNSGIRRPVVVRNVPMLQYSAACASGQADVKTIFGLAEDDVVFIYQGKLADSRGVLRFLSVFSQCRSDKHVVFMGYGSLEESVREHASMHRNIHYLSAVPVEQVLDYTSSADVGICGMGEGSLSYKYSLPNKFFEYLLAGLPVLIGDRVEQRMIIEENDCGWTVGSDDQQFICLVNSIDREQIAKRKRGALRARQKFNWENEVTGMLRIYDRHLNDGAEGR